MKVVNTYHEMEPAFLAASAEARSAFGDDTLYLERFIGNARHIEVQVLGDRFGNVIHLGERDCSLQRRHQKIIEEAPAPEITASLRTEIRQAAVALARSMNYESAGTVEFIYDEDEKKFYFLEMNTRIQVEHPITEAITGVDLVQQQLLVASGQPLNVAQSEVAFRGMRSNAVSPLSFRTRISVQALAALRLGTRRRANLSASIRIASRAIPCPFTTIYYLRS